MRRVVVKVNYLAGDASVIISSKHSGKLGYIVVDGRDIWKLSR